MTVKLDFETASLIKHLSLKTYFKIILFCHLSLLPFGKSGSCFAQTNLVPNYSFEEYNSCPTISTRDCQSGYPNIPALKDWHCVVDAFSTPDYLNNCSSFPYGYNNFRGYQAAKTGQGYIGGIMNVFNRAENIEYIQCKLKDSLKPLINYCVQFYISRAEWTVYPSSEFAALFTNNQLNVPGFPIIHFINLIPQVKNPLGNFIKDSINWTKIEGSFIAMGGEKHMTLGCFGPNTITDTIFDSYPSNFNIGYNYYYFDDVSVEEVINAKAGKDTLIDCGNSVGIGGDSAIGATYKWFPSNGLDDDTKAFPIASPTITTNYVLQKTQCKIITYDNVTVRVTNTCPYINYLDDFKIPNVFTPNGDNTNDVWQFTLGFGNNLKSLHIYDRWGLEILIDTQETKTMMRWDGRTTAGEACTAGVYFYTLEYTNVLDEHKKLNGYITLIK